MTGAILVATVTVFGLVYLALFLYENPRGRRHP